MKTTLRKITLPTNEPVADAVTALWLECFGPAEVEGTRAQFAGLETAANIDTLYVLECDGALGACCHITRRLGTGLAMLGGVASAPAFRGKGFGRAVCAFAMADFDREGGEAIWLCTGNPVAADLYESLGFHYQAGAHVMARLQPGWQGMKLSRRLYPGGECEVKAASPALRVPMIPLICGRNTTLVLDANVGLCSTRCMALASCTGLYPRFLQMRERGGECLYLQDKATGGIAGIATIVPQPDGTLQADAFWHPGYESQAAELIQAVAALCPGRPLRFPVADEAKERMLSALGAKTIGDACLAFGSFALPARLMELAPATALRP